MYLREKCTLGFQTLNVFGFYHKSPERVFVTINIFLNTDTHSYIEVYKCIFLCIEMYEGILFKITIQKYERWFL